MSRPIRWGVLAAILVSAAAWAARKRSAEPAPGPAAAPALVAAAALKAKLDAGRDLLLVFVGTESFFRERHIPGAVCVDYGRLAAAFENVDRRREIVLYCGCCGDAAEGVSGLAARRLLAMGFQRVAHLEGHYAAWHAAGYPAGGTNPPPPPETAYAGEGQKRELEAFSSEQSRRRAELAAAVDGEPDPARRAELRRRLDEADQEDEIRGLRLKRRLADESGNPAKVAEIDRILKLKETPDRP